MISPLLTDLPEALQKELAHLNDLPIERLSQIAQSVLSAHQQAKYSRLLERQREDQITQAEEKQLNKLYRLANRQMLQKAYANVLLKLREQPQPDMGECK